MVSTGVLLSLPVCPGAHAQTNTPPPAQTDTPQDNLNYNAPWPATNKTNKAQSPLPVKTTPAVQPATQPSPAPATKPAAVPPPAAAAPVAPAVTTAPVETQSAQPEAGMFSPSSQTQRTRVNELSVSGDYLLGKGRVTLPLGFSLQKAFGSSGLGSITPRVDTPPRSSDYFGATLSYSYGQSWFVDLSYANGSSSGTVDVGDVLAPGSGTQVPSHFTIKDDWFQAYVRYTFPSLRGKRLSAYLRAGISYVTATLTDDSVFPEVGEYHQDDKTTDLLGNLGFGVGYSLYRTSRTRLALQLEGEGFYGTRNQKSLETLPQLAPFFFTSPFQTASFDDTLYGGIGRATVRFEYRLGQSGAFRVFADGGIEEKYTRISYPQTGEHRELLWGPYAKVGVRYSF